MSYSPLDVAPFARLLTNTLTPQLLDAWWSAYAISKPHQELLCSLYDLAFRADYPASTIWRIECLAMPLLSRLCQE